MKHGPMKSSPPLSSAWQTDSWARRWSTLISQFPETSNNHGHKIGAKYHFLKGRNLSGDFSSDRDVLDLDRGRECYLLAARYAGNHVVFKKEALSRAAWCFYCKGNLDAARETIGQACSLAADYPEADYYAAKFAFAANCADEAKVPFKRAAIFDPLSVVRADNDEDFTPYKVIWKGWAEEVREAGAAVCLDLAQERYRFDLLDRLFSLYGSTLIEHDNDGALARAKRKRSDLLSTPTLIAILDFIVCFSKADPSLRKLSFEGFLGATKRMEEDRSAEVVTVVAHQKLE